MGSEAEGDEDVDLLADFRERQGSGHASTIDIDERT